jgi:hypothetical protein
LSVVNRFEHPSGRIEGDYRAGVFKGVSANGYQFAQLFREPLFDLTKFARGDGRKRRGFR